MNWWSQHIQYEIWEKILCHAISQLYCLWPNHRCSLFTRISASRQFYQIIETLKRILPTIYISDSTWLNQQPGNRAVNTQRLFEGFGSWSNIIIELKRIIASSKWNSVWVVLFLDVLGWFFMSNIFRRKNKLTFTNALL